MKFCFSKILSQFSWSIDIYFIFEYAYWYDKMIGDALQTYKYKDFGSIQEEGGIFHLTLTLFDMGVRIQPPPVFWAGC